MAVAAVVFAVLVLFIPRLTAVSLQKGFLEQDGDCSIYNYEEHQYVRASHGDVKLTDTSLVQICINSQWAIVDGEEQGPTVPDTLCRQLGYEDGSGTFERSDEFSTLWLQKIDCPVDYQAKHILRCNYTLSSNVDRSFEMHLRCSSYSTRHPGMRHNENTYPGQVALVPPFDWLSLNLSHSWGVIIIKRYAGGQGDKWNYIRNTGSLLTLNDTDTICREMDYTRSVINSLQTVESLQYSFELNVFGRISSSQFSCLHSYQCAGCCFNLTIHDYQELSNLRTSDPNAFVIQCAFDTPPPVSGGYREICEASPKDGTIKNKDVCQSPCNLADCIKPASDENSTTDQLISLPTGSFHTEKTVSLDIFEESMIPVSIIAVLLILVIITIIAVYFKRKCQNGYERIRVQERERAVQEQEGAVQEQERVVQEREGAVQEGEGAVQERERVVQEQEGAVQEREGAVQEQERVVQEREGAVQEREQAVQERERAVQEQERAAEGGENEH